MASQAHSARYRGLFTGAVLCILALAGCSGGDVPVSQPASQPSAAAGAALTAVHPKPPGRWTPYRVKADDHVIDTYVVHDEQPKPVLIIVHGSGCAPLVTADADGTFHDTTLFQDAIASLSSAVHVALIDKRGVMPLRFTAGMSRQQQLTAFAKAGETCGDEYLRHVTKQERVADVLAVTTALRHQPWARQILMVGHSEGTHVVTGVLYTEANAVAAAGLFASAGPIPFFGGYAAGDTADRERFRSIFDRVRTLQRADDDVMYRGLPARRWKTFWLQSTPIEDVRESRVPLFVAQGSSDDTSLPADLFVLEAIRQQPSRPVRYVLVQKGGHAFETPDGTSHVTALLTDFVRWGLDEDRETVLSTLQ